MAVVEQERYQAPAGTTDRVMAELFPEPSPWVNDPVGFCNEVLGFFPWSKQREVLESVRDHRRTAVRSCHGVGKTAVAARIALWFMVAFPGDTRVITTGASWDGVEKLLWKEIHEAYHRAKPAIGGRLSSTELDMGGVDDQGNPKWFAMGLSTNKPERFAGHHADHLLLIVDESSGVDERIFEAASGYMTNPKMTARLLLIGNPTQLSGEFYAAFNDKADEYHTIHVSAFDTPEFTGEKVPEKVLASVTGKAWVEEMERLYGAESSVFQVRVLGDFPSTADDTVCSLADVEAAQKRKMPDGAGEPAVVTCDVARFGSDETVISVRRGNKVRVVRRYVGQDTMRTVGEILTIARAVGKVFPPSMIRIVIDDVGVGGGVTDRLMEIGEFQIVPFNGGAESWSGDYPNRRSELWFTFSERLGELDLDDDAQLRADLVAPKYKLDSRGRRVVEAKVDTKKRLKRSPDTADSVLLAFAVPDHVFSMPTGASKHAPITAGLMERAW